MAAGRLSCDSEDDVISSFLHCEYVYSIPFIVSAGKECIERRLTALQSGLCV